MDRKKDKKAKLEEALRKNLRKRKISKKKQQKPSNYGKIYNTENNF